MQYSLYINQLFIVSHPQCDDLDFTDIAIFDCVRKLIAGNWGRKELKGTVVWANISTKKILEEMPMLRASRDKPMTTLTVHRRITKLCEAGLLQRDNDNQKKSVSFLALGPIAGDYDSFREPLSKKIVVSEHPLSEMINPIIENDNRPLSNLIDNKNTIQNTLSNLSDPPSQAKEEKAPKISKDKKRLTRKDVTEFYENEEMEFLKAPVLPPDLLAAAAARRLTADLLLEGYREIVDYMMKPSDMWPNGMWSCVLTKPNQLGFLQFCKLILDSGMTRAWIKDYLNQWENKKYDNDNIYATFITWWRKQSKSNGGTETSKTGLPAPKTITQ